MNDFLRLDEDNDPAAASLLAEAARLWEEESTGSEENETWQYTE